MSTSNKSNPAPGTGSVTLIVSTEDDASEIFVINGDFNLVCRGIGPRQEFKLQPGIYKVKVQAGTETREEHVALFPGSPPVTQKFPRLAFASPAPLSDTSKTHEFHIGAASQHSHHIDVHAGDGSSIFVFARGWTEKQRTDLGTHHRQHPALGLKLWSETGELIADVEKTSKTDLGWEPWAACNVSVSPGNYRLSLEIPSLGQTVEQSVVASPGWQTQIFLLQRDYRATTERSGQSKPELRADLLGSSVLMSRVGFEAHDQDMRMTEFARLALANQRQILSDEVRTMLRYKFENPMLGIFGAHLLLLDEKPDKELLGIVVKNLRRIVGNQHPDVEALALRVDASSQYSFRFPPMLKRSWSLICDATADRPHLVPEDSLLAGVAQCQWGESIWLMWLTHKAGAMPERVAQDEDALNDIEEAILAQYQSTMYRQRRTRSRRRADLGGAPKSGLAGATVGAAMSVVDKDDMEADDVADEGFESVADETASAVDQIDADPETIKKLTRQLGVPRSAIEKTVQALRDKRKS